MRHLVAVSIIPILLATSFAQEADPQKTEKGKFGHSFLDRLSNTPLPFTTEDSGFSVDIRPKLGDVIHEPFIRLPMELNYGFTPNSEGSIGYIPFFNNPTDSDQKSSDGYLTLDYKQRINDLAEERLNLAVGFAVKVPLEEIPSERMRDSYDSYIPYVTAAYRLDEERQWLAFTTLQYRMVGDDRREGTTSGPDPRSLAVIQPGLIYQPEGEYRYSLQLEYITDRVDGGRDDGFKIIPGVTWFPPPETPFFRSIAGHFELSLDVEFALAEIEEEELGSDIGVSLGVRWRLYPTRRSPEESVL